LPSPTSRPGIEPVQQSKLLVFLVVQKFSTLNNAFNNNCLCAVFESLKRTNEIKRLRNVFRKNSPAPRFWRADGKQKAEIRGGVATSFPLAMLPPIRPAVGVREERNMGSARVTVARKKAKLHGSSSRRVQRSAAPIEFVSAI
jgi:hypothetical protein